MTSSLPSILLVWLLAAVGIVLVGVLSSPDRYFVWLPIVLAVAVLSTFVVQLAIPRQEGLVMRMAVSVSGCVVLLALATAVLAALAA